MHPSVKQSVNPSVIPIGLLASESSGFRFHFNWYNVICGHIRSMFSTVFLHEKPRESSLESISNPSLVSAEESVEEIEELSPSEQFSWTRMANIFSEYQMVNVKQSDQISKETIQITQKLFDHLLFDEEKYVDSIYDSFMKLDKTYAERFFYYSQMPKIRPREYVTKHIKKILELHRFLLIAFEDDRTKAFQILNLLALSHSLMRVTIADFRLFDLVMGKFFYRMEMMDDTNVHHIVGYMSTVTMHIEKLLRRHNLENRKRALLLVDNSEYLVDINSVCRENYRELKKWNQIQWILRKSIADREEEHLRETISDSNTFPIDSPAPEVKKIVYTTDSQSDQMENKLIDFLKKGYKYKEHEL